jgi:hypothetical protein
MITTSTTTLTSAPQPVDDQPVTPARLALGQVMLVHAGLGEDERGHHPDRAQRQQRGGLGVEPDDENIATAASAMMPLEYTRLVELATLGRLLDWLCDRRVPLTFAAVRLASL